LLSQDYKRTKDEAQHVFNRVGAPTKKKKKNQEAAIKHRIKTRKARLPATPSPDEELFYRTFYTTLGEFGVFGIPYLAKKGKTFFTKNSREAYAAVRDNNSQIELLDASAEAAAIYKDLAIWAYQRGLLISAAKGSAAPTLPDVFAVLVYDRGFISEVLGKYNNAPVTKETGDHAQSKLRGLLDEEGQVATGIAELRPRRTTKRSRLPRSLEHAPREQRAKQFA
jgi:hypothetical protein